MGRGGEVCGCAAGAVILEKAIGHSEHRVHRGKTKAWMSMRNQLMGHGTGNANPLIPLCVPLKEGIEKNSL